MTGKGEEEGWPRKGAKRKKGRPKKGQFLSLAPISGLTVQGMSRTMGCELGWVCSCLELLARGVFGCCFGSRPKDVPAKASHPNFPHFQSIEYAEHWDRPEACRKTQGNPAKTQPT